MIPPREQWVIQIDVTNRCPRKCSNCTRSLAHAREPFLMDTDTFAQAIEATKDFPTESPPDHLHRTKVVGIIGGEPQMHPQFRELVEIVEAGIPTKKHRGLWTGLPVGITTTDRFGFLNKNTHNTRCEHQPVLVAIQDVIQDEARMWKLIDECWLNREWGCAITPKGFFFCEVAAGMDTVFDGPGGLPIKPGCWSHDLAEYREQIERWCPRCGICIPGLKGRLDSEERDDITRSNLEALKALGSPRIERGEYIQFNPILYQEDHRNWQPQRYLKDGK